MSRKRKVRKLEKKKKAPKRRILGRFLLSFLLIGIIGILVYVYFNPVLINRINTNVSVGSEYNPKDAITLVLFANKDDVKIETNVDTNKIGTYETKYTLNDYSVTVPIKVVDDVPPVLKLKEYTTDEVEEVKPESFIEKIYDVSEVQTKILKEKKTEKGIYTVTIEAEDSYGNKTVENTTLYRKKDKTAPTFTTELTEAVFYVGEDFDYLAGVQVKDDLDTNPKIETNAKDVVNGVGEFTVTYKVSDRTGNTTEATRLIRVEDVPEETQRIVYLTFDDGPSNNTERVLDILAQYGVKATFFVTGNGQTRNDLIQRAYNEGHTIGLHTYTHDYSIYQSEETYFNDLQAISDMVYNLIGIRSNVIRFPGGSSNTISANYNAGIMSRLVNQVQERGYYYFDWNVSSSDASGNNVDRDQIIAYSTSGSEYDHIVLLMHDTDAKDTTVEALPSVIEYYQSQGYIFKGLSSRSPECHHGVNN